MKREQYLEAARQVDELIALEKRKVSLLEQMAKALRQQAEKLK